MISWLSILGQLLRGKRFELLHVVGPRPGFGAIRIRVGHALLARQGGSVLQTDRQSSAEGAFGGIGETRELDTILVCAGGNPALFDHAPTLRWLRAAARRGHAVGGVSGGPTILAKAGLLDGYRATVHWEHASAFAEAFPDVHLAASLYEIDRDRLTRAGGVAALDMMHHVIGTDHGYDLARAVSDWFLQAHIRPGSGGQRLGLRERLGVRSPQLEAVVAMMQARLDEPASRAELAAIAGLSLRQLDRLFADHLGLSAERFYLQLRLDRARELLLQTSLPVTQVAIATGFVSASHFSRAFRRRFSKSPRSERDAPPDATGAVASSPTRPA